jgi:hypothetical protein
MFILLSGSIDTNERPCLTGNDVGVAVPKANYWLACGYAQSIVFHSLGEYIGIFAI